MHTRGSDQLQDWMRLFFEELEGKMLSNKYPEILLTWNFNTVQTHMNLKVSRDDL